MRSLIFIVWLDVNVFRKEWRKRRIEKHGKVSYKLRQANRIKPF